MNKIYKIKYLLKFSTCFLFLFSSCFADWNPEFIDDVDLTALENPEYQKLKISVLKEQENSWCSAEKTNLIMDLVLLTKPSVCVEIGAWIGSSVVPALRSLSFLGHGKLYAIDAWSNQTATRYWDDTDPNKPWWSTVDMRQIHQLFQQTIHSRSLEQYCTEIALPSEEAVLQLPEIDFLHLDGDYSEKGSMQDVELYLPKVKSGGYILLSNLFMMINGKQPKLQSFIRLMEECDIVCEIERDNAVLFRKQ